MDSNDNNIIDVKKQNSAEKTSSANSNGVISNSRKEIIKELADMQKSAPRAKKVDTSNNEDLPVNSEQNLDANSEQSQKYQDFLERYEVKVREIVEKPVAKYNSELDFRLNQRIKKVRFPKTKTQKLLIAVAIFMSVIAVALGLIFGLKDNTPPVVLSNISLSQPMSDNIYQVTGVYVGDELSCKNIDLICEYSDGTTQKKAITNNMLQTSSPKFDKSSNVFTESGIVEFELVYENKTLKINFVVKEYQLESITIDAPQMGNLYNILATKRSLDLSKSIVVNANYSNGRTAKIDLSSCKYKVGDMEPASIKNGTIYIVSLSDNTVYSVTIYYKEGEIEKVAQFTIKTYFQD